MANGTGWYRKMPRTITTTQFGIAREAGGSSSGFPSFRKTATLRKFRVSLLHNHVYRPAYDDGSTGAQDTRTAAWMSTKH
jgi:hypothetical protein